MTATVVGGGIGGLAAALALRRAGLTVTVLEAKPKLVEAGAGLSLWPNAVRALEALGVAEEVLARGAVMDTNLIQRWDGKVLGGGRLNLERRYGAPGVCVRRADLLAALHAALGSEGVHTGARVVTLQHTRRGAAAVMADGGRVDADFLVGADGLHSVVRNALLGDEPRSLGSIAWRGLAKLRTKGGGLALGHRSHAGWLPVDSDYSYWFCCRDGDAGRRIGDLRTELLELFGRWWDPIPALIQSTPSREILRHQIYDRPPAWSWGAERLTLLGDAAHPMSPAAGQGACLALEDAVVLASCISRRPDPAAALRLYEAERMPRAARMQRASLRALRALQPRSQAAHVARDLIVRMPAGLLAAGQAWMFEFPSRRRNSSRKTVFGS
jgi:2-polyprenyl-6-methoxyphenol hydroxylase-like FAD-dependent oxidoreductase